MKTASTDRKAIINPIFRDSALFSVTSTESGGKLTRIELELSADGSNVPHFHTKFSETFIPKEGTLMLRLTKGKSLLLNPGEKFTVQPGVIHNFHNPGNEKISFRVEINPGSLRLEQAIHIAYKMALEGLMTKKGIPKDFTTLCLLTEMSNTCPSGILSVLQPLIRSVARRASKQGLYKQLIKKYCTEDYFFIRQYDAALTL